MSSIIEELNKHYCIDTCINCNSKTEFMERRETDGSIVNGCPKCMGYTVRYANVNGKNVISLVSINNRKGVRVKIIDPFMTFFEYNVETKHIDSYTNVNGFMFVNLDNLDDKLERAKKLQLFK